MRKPPESGAQWGGSFLQLLRMRNFRLLWGAGALSAIGDQFDLIAFPWLVLLITGDPLAVGAVIAVGGVPTVIFMLLGGSLVDRFSPRAIMQVSNIMRIALSVSLAALILTGMLELWLIYIFALLKGISDSFFYPAQMAIVPRVVPTERLRQSNTLIQTTTELGGFIGPMLAGGLIAFFGSGSGAATFGIAGIPEPQAVAGANLTGVGLAFAVVGLVIFVSSLLLGQIRLVQQGSESTEQERKDVNIFKSIGEGIRFVRADAAMFTMFLLIVGVELLVEGPFIVGLPFLANTKLAEGGARPGSRSVRVRRRVAAWLDTGRHLAGTQTPVRANIGDPDCLDGPPVDAIWLSGLYVDCRRRGSGDRVSGRIYRHHVYDVASGAHASEIDGTRDEPSDDFRRWPIPTLAHGLGRHHKAESRVALRGRGRAADFVLPIIPIQARGSKH